MSRPATFPHLLAFSSAVLLLGGTGAALAQDRVGVSSAVNEQATGTPPGRSARPLIIGQEVVYNERITTTDVGQSQLLFLDESSMSIGPNSDLTIDQFVYDPRTGTGKLAMTATRGLLRYVGGKLSKQDDAVTMRTNSGTLAVRGGAFLVNQTLGGSLEAVFIYGRGLTVTGSTGATETLRRPGFAVTIAGPGAAPSAPFPVPPGELAQLLAQLDGRRGASGGARTVPTEQAVAASGVAQTISGNIAASVQQATAQTQVATVPTGVNPATVQTRTSVQQAATSLVDCVSQGTCPPQTITTSPTRPVSPTTSGAYGGFYKTTPGTGSSVGFVSTSPSFNIPYTGGQIGADGFYTATLNGTTIRFPVAANGGFRTFTPADGSDSPFGPISGTSFITGDRTFLYSNNTEVDFADEHSFVHGGIPVDPSFFQPRPSFQFYAFALQPDAALQSGVPFIRNDAGGNLPNPTVSPFFIAARPNTQFGSFNETSNPTGTSPRTLQASFGINGQGPSQSSVLVVSTGTFDSTDTGQVYADGIVRGSFRGGGSAVPVRISSNLNSVRDALGNSLYGGTSVTGFVLDQNNQDSSTGAVVPTLATEAPLVGSAVSYAFNNPAVATTLPAGLGASRTSQTLSGSFGGIMEPRGGGGNTPYVLTGNASVRTSATDSRVAATFSGSDPFTSATSGIQSMNIQFGEVANRPFARAAFIDDAHFAALESPDVSSQINGTSLPTAQNGVGTAVSPRLAMVTGNTVSPNPLLPNGLCQACQFLQWGFWTGELDTPDSTGTAVIRRDRAHINTWIAGVPTSAADLNVLQGSAVTGTYTGNAIGSVVNNGASYLASGGFNASYNFGTQNAAIAITNFDGKNFAASGRLPLSGANYAAPFGNTAFSGQIRGSFYGPMAAETGGSFAVQSVPGTTPYLASGIFAAKR